ncbi:MAG: hypothetical protein ACQESK_06370 [Bacteroidota bacterium]
MTDQIKHQFLALILLVCTTISAQETYHFLDKNTSDTIKYYKLLLYENEQLETYKPNHNHKIKVEKERLEKADSIVLNYDAWYNEKIAKSSFSKQQILVDKQLDLDEVVVSHKKTKTIGSHLGKKSGVRNLGKAGGSLVQFKLDSSAVKIEKFSILIRRNKEKNSSFIPVLFAADSINDPNKTHLYPENEGFELENKFRKEWITVLQDKKVYVSKKFIYAGYKTNVNSVEIIMGTSYHEANTFVDDYSGSFFIRKGENKFRWSNSRAYRIEDYYIPAVKIELITY